MDVIINRSPKSISPKLSTQNIEIVVRSYESTRKESFDNENDPNNVVSDDKLLFDHKLSWISRIRNCFMENKINVINKMLSITIHVFIMVMFEIYFYFNYVIYLEKDEFMRKISSYVNELDNIQFNPIEKKIAGNAIIKNSQQVSSQLYLEYIESLYVQSQLKNQLLILSYKMASVVGSILGFFLLWGLFNWKEIKWKTILIENVLMFVFLGTFEYMFFSRVILQYNPVTDGEIKYTVYEGIVNYLNQTAR